MEPRTEPSSLTGQDEFLLSGAEMPEAVDDGREGLDGEPDSRAEAMSLHAPLLATLQAQMSGSYRAEQLQGYGLFQAPWGERETLNLDVDGLFPQSTASGTIRPRLGRPTHWVARLRRTGWNRWSGPIWFRRGGDLPFAQVELLVGAAAGTNRRVLAVFNGPGSGRRRRLFRFASSTFRDVEFEFDRAEGATVTTAIDTHAHPVRPSALAQENLTVASVYERAGFRVLTSSAGGQVPLPLSGADGVWSDAELHDAMQAYWSRFRNRAQWAMWVFFASMHEQGQSLGGVMFDDIGPHHRQGTAIFTDSFISRAPDGDPAPAAWVRRMLFWTACHEMGHAFNLAHSWQKALGEAWTPLVDEPEARSFMNYPYRVAGGQRAFFGDFPFRFSDAELLFLRHAPQEHVQMGNAAWFDDHGFESAEVSPEPRFALSLRVHRDAPRLEFLEPAVVELKLLNLGDQPQIVGADTLSDCDHLMLVVKKEGREARVHRPYAHRCQRAEQRVLAPGEALYESVFVGAGRGGWLVDEPGRYTLQALVRIGGEDVVSPPLRLKVEPPRGFDAELLAQDVLEDPVGRVLAFDGSRFLRGASDTLRELSARLPESKAAVHARVALACQRYKPAKVLELGAGDEGMRSAGESRARVVTAKAAPEEAKSLFRKALLEQGSLSAATLGHIDFRDYVAWYADWRAGEGDAQEAAQALQSAAETLAQRGVLASVVAALKDWAQDLSDTGRGGAGGKTIKPRERKPKG